jgi:uncharacterized protein (TIGR02001 family)
MKKIVSPILVALTLSAAAGAMAQTAAPAAPESTLAYNIGAVSDYRYRGISQTRKQATLQGGFDYNDKSGFYVGAWASGIKWIQDAGAKDGTVEIDLYGGYKGAAGDVAYDVGFLRYQYQGNTLAKVSGLVDANTNEVYAAATMGLFTAKYSYATSNLFGNPKSSGSYYLDLSAAVDLGEGYSLTPHLGYQNIAKTPDGTYTDYALTLGKDLGNGLSASAAVIGTNAKKSFYFTPSGKPTGDTGLVVGVKYTF